MRKTLIVATLLAITLQATAYAAGAASMTRHRIEVPSKIACTQTGCMRISAQCHEKHTPDGIVPRGFDTIKCKAPRQEPISAASATPGTL